MRKYLKSPKDKDNIHNLSFICTNCNKKYHFSKLSTSLEQICIYCHPPDELEAAIRDSLHYRNLHNRYHKDELKHLFQELNETFIKINEK